MSRFDFTIYVYQLIGVLAAALVGMVVVWAVGSKWHWFVRTAIVLAVVMSPLLFSAYEVTVELGVGAALFAGGLTLWRRRLRRVANPELADSQAQGPRVSLQTVMLVMVVAAVVLAVVAHLRPSRLGGWGLIAVAGIFDAGIWLACAWPVLGRARWWTRLVVTLIIFATCIGAVYAVRIVQQQFFALKLQPGTPIISQLWTIFWQTAIRLWPRYFFVTAIPTAFGMAAFCGWLKLMMAAGWLDWPTNGGKEITASAANAGSPQRKVWLRFATITLTVAIAALPLYVLARLSFPRPLPPEADHPDDGYRELIAIGQSLVHKSADNRSVLVNISDAKFRALLERDEPELQRLQAVIEQGCRFPMSQPARPEVEMNALDFLVQFMRIRVEKGDSTGSVESRARACLDLIRLSQMQSRSQGVEFSSGFSFAEPEEENELWNLRGELSGQQCKELATALVKFEEGREPWARMVDRQRLLMANQNWNTHLTSIAMDVSGAWYVDQAPFGRMDRLLSFVTRLLITDLGIRAFEQAEGRLPNTLNELVPSYLPTLPTDPLGVGPLKFKRTGDTYLLYGVGPNGVDEGGKFDMDSPGGTHDDMRPERWFQPPRPRPATKAAAAATEK